MDNTHTHFNFQYEQEWLSSQSSLIKFVYRISYYLPNISNISGIVYLAILLFLFVQIIFFFMRLIYGDQQLEKFVENTNSNSDYDQKFRNKIEAMRKVKNSEAERYLKFFKNENSAIENINKNE